MITILMVMGLFGAAFLFFTVAGLSLSIALRMRSPITTCLLGLLSLITLVVYEIVAIRAIYSLLAQR